jgi:glycosyltransferase involved in cell wall biosynthesis
MFQRRVATIFCVAPGIRDQVIRRGAAPGKVQILPNAIATDRFPVATDDERDRARTTLELPPEAKVLLHLGWDWHRKGGDVFVDAVTALRNSMGQTPVVGATVGGEGGEKRDLPDGVVTLAPTSDVQSLYAAADVLVSPSRAEGQPYAVMEALSCGTPVVASDIPGHTLIADGISDCRIVPGEDSLRVAAAAQELLSRDPSTARAEATAAHDAMVDRFGVSAWSDKLLDCYRRLAAEPDI